MLVQLVYISTPKLGHRDEINTNLEKIQAQNKLLGISGMILSHENFFLQLLEGNRELVNKLFSKISHDWRHDNVTILRYTDIRKAEFSDWNFAVIDNDTQCHVNESCREFLGRLVPDIQSITADMTSSAAMSILRKAAMVALIERAPHRRATDIAEVFTYTAK